MELTIEQALHQGVTAHNAGNLQEAERFYKAILQSQPRHPDASHNLGLIAISANQIEAALTLFKTALGVNPNIEQFWLSYIDALVKAKRLKDAKQAITKAQKKGFDAKKLEALLSQSKAVIDTKVPPQAQVKTLLEHYQNRRFGDAEKLAISVTHEFPQHQFAWKVLGAIFGQTDRNSEAVNANQTAVELVPQDADAHNNLGVTLQELGRLDEAEASYTQAIALKPDFAKAHSNLGITLRELGRLDEAEASYTQAITLKPDFAEAHSNLGRMFREQGRLDEAEASYTQAIALKPDFAKVHNNLGVMQQELGRLDEAEASYTQAITLKPDFAEAHSNLGRMLQGRGRLDEAEASCAQAIALKPDFAQAHSNLGNTLRELGRLDEAEASYTQAITLKPDFAEAHSNLGNTLRELGRLDEAEASYTQAITLKPDFAAAYFKLGQILYANGDIDRAIEIHQKAYEIDSSMRENELLLNVLRSKITRVKTAQNINTVNKSDTELGLNSNIIIQDRVVEAELISHLYEINSSSLDEAPGPRYGNGRCSPDYSLFNNDQFIIKTVKDDLIKIMKLAVKSEIYVFDSFFNIYGAGAGIPPHQHFNKLDKDRYHNLERQKYSLVYYLSVGDQDCSEPGILKLYGPEQDILPCEGMIIIFPASRMHSAVYGGQTDRVMIGVNFYSL
jgi:tetratricopeptide (TPR) repeat protein